MGVGLVVFSKVYGYFGIYVWISSVWEEQFVIPVFLYVFLVILQLNIQHTVLVVFGISYILVYRKMIINNINNKSRKEFESLDGCLNKADPKKCKLLLF